VSLGIMIKGSEGMVLAADSRVTLFNPVNAPVANNQTIVIPATFDNATKILKVAEQDYVGAVTYGVGAFFTPHGPRTMQSFLPEFEEMLKKKNTERLSVPDFAKLLSDFYKERWDTFVNRPPNPGEEINFLVGGYDEGAAYGRGFGFSIPSNPGPVEQNAVPGAFGITWGGQHDLAFRILYGFDPGVPEFLRTELKLQPQQLEELKKKMEARFAAGIPYQFLPLQDCVDLAVFLIEDTIRFQQYRTTVVRGVGGPVEVATITRDGKFQFLSHKQVGAPRKGA
jgi:hypothetical protein